MALALTLHHRCDVQRYTTTAQGYGTKRTAAAHLTGVYCRLMTKTERAYNSLTAQWLVDTRYRLLMPYTTDVLAGDRIANLVDEDGDAVAGVWEVTGVLKRRGRTARHLSLDLQKVA